MAPKRYLAISGICLAAIGLALLLFLDTNLYFRGRHLSHWAELYYHSLDDGQEDDRARAAEAIETIGTNGLPVLLELMTAEPPVWRDPVYRMFNITIGQLHDEWQLVANDDGPASAATAFGVLGTNAAPAIPQLTLLMNDSSQNSSPLAAAALGSIGLPALPAITAGLTNQDSEVRRFALLFSCTPLGTNAEAVLPILLDLIETPRPQISPDERKRIIGVLAWLRLAPEQVIPVLERRLADGNAHVRYATVQGLGTFARSSKLALLALQQATNSSYPDVQKTAKQVLESIDQPDPYSTPRVNRAP